MKLRLKGAKGIKAGPALTWDGPDEIEIDFTGKNGLIALSGENGGGKTTVLESLSVYPQFVSRSGALWQGFMGREAEKEFECDFMGSHYRSLIKMDCEQGKQEGYLWLNNKPMVSGKITAYKEAVNSIFGQPFIYFRSQFCPQKSKATKDMQLENLTTGVFRELLREFLNLQKYAQWEETAKQAGNFYQGQVAGLDQRVAGLESTVKGKTDIEIDRMDMGNKVTFLQDDKTLLIQVLEEKRQAVDALKATIQANALALQRKADLQSQIERMEGELEKEKQAAEIEIAAISEKWKPLKHGIKNCDEILKDRESIEKADSCVREITVEAQLLQVKIDALSADLPAHQQKVHDLEKEIEQLKSDAKYMMTDTLLFETEKQRAKINEDIEDRKRMLRDLDNELFAARLRQEIKHLEARSKVGEGLDADCRSITCSAIAEINGAKARLPEAQEELKAVLQRNEETRKCITAAVDGLTAELLGADAKLKERRDFLKQQTERINGEVEKLTTDLKTHKQTFNVTTTSLAGYRQDLAAKRVEIAKQAALVDKLPDVRVAETRKADLEKQLEEVTKAGTIRREAWITKEIEMKISVDKAVNAQSLIAIDDKAEWSLKYAQDEISVIETVKIPAVETEIQTARDRIATLQAELTRIEAAEKELAEIKGKRDLLARSMISWRYLQFATGKTGLQNLRIDGAAPRIVYNANRLLSQAYGALYSIRLETVNEAGKEDLQIKIIMENGQEVYLDDISGGQRAWNVQALWLAMSLLNQEKSGRKYDYFCSDESDGALDTENAEKYTALYRPFMEQAELSQLLFISHKDSCRAMADHVLTFEHGKNPAWG